MKDAYSLDIDNYVDLKKLKKMINFKENSIYIVMYHYIRDKKKDDFPKLKSLEFSQFKKQINFFKKIKYFRW